jgi:hypothetical protein
MGIKIISTAAGLNKYEVGLGNVQNIEQAPLDHQHPANRITIDDAGYYFFAENVEDALQELAENIASIEQGIGNLERVTATINGDNETTDFVAFHYKGTKNVITSIRDNNDNMCLPLIKYYTNYVLIKFKKPQPSQVFYITIV